MKIRAFLSAVVTMAALVCASAIAETRSWTGEAGDGKWSTPGNWSGETVPASGDAVSFGEAQGGTLDMDIANLSLLSLGYGSGAGAYAVSGEALGVTSALTSDASVAQTISAPVNLGAANAGQVTVGGAGAIDLTGATSFQGKELVKTGSGVFTTTEGAVYGPQKITVKGGTFKIGARSSAYADGSKYYPGSLSGDANNPTLLWRNTQLSDVVGVSARPATTTMGLGSVMCPFFWKNDGTTATVQFQKAHEDGRYIMTVLVSFKQEGPHVYAYATAAKYSTNLSDLGSDWTGFAQNGTVVGPNVLSGGYNVRDVMPILKENGESPWTAGYVPFEKDEKDGMLVWKNTRLADVVSATAEAAGGTEASKGRSGYYNPGPWLWQNDGQTATVQFQKFNSYTRCVTVRLMQKGSDVWAVALRASYTTTNILGTDMSTGYTDFTSYSSPTGGYAIENLRPVFNKAPGSEASFVVEDGARLDVNVDQAAGAIQNAEPTHGKVVYVEGDGPDSNGALYNSNASLRYGASFGHIVLTGDASIGGTGRMDLRPLQFSAVAALDYSAILEGPHVLTLKPGARFGLYRATLDLDRIDVAGTLVVDGTIPGAVANGFHLLDGSTMLCSSTAALPAEMPIFAEGAQTEINNTAQPASLSGDLVVGENAKLSVTGTKAVKLAGAAEVDGILDVSNAEGLVFQNSLEGKGSVSGKVAFEGNDFTLKVIANAEGLVSSVDLDGAIETTPSLLTGIKKVEVVFVTKPDQSKKWEHRLASQGSLTSEGASAIFVEAVDAEGNPLPGARLTIADDSLMLCANDETTPVTVHWTGEGNPANPADPNNWECVNAFGETVPGAIPTANSTVYLTQGISFSCPAGASFLCKSLVVDAALSDNCDWRGLDIDLIDAGGTLDLNGHNLTLALTKDIAKALTVTDSQEIGGELHLEVPEGVTAKNENLTLTGSLKLVKDGAGTFTAAKTAQTYCGGTEITAGLVNLPAITSAEDLTYAGHRGLFGPADSAFTIRRDGIFDICGNYVYNSYATVLDGGILRNSVKQPNHDFNSCCNITLTSDSKIEVKEDMVFNVTGGNTTKPVNLNGFTLAVKIEPGKHLYMCNYGAFANGTVNFDTDGWFHPYPCNGWKTALDLRSVNFIGRVALYTDLEVSFGDLTTQRADTYFTANKPSSIYGVFTPESPYWKNFTMMDGSTLNLSEATLPFDISSSITKDTLKFADDATIKVDLSGREEKLGGKVLSWTTKPANVRTLRFKVVDESGKYNGCYLKAENDGLYLNRGFVLILR